MSKYYEIIEDIIELIEENKKLKRAVEDSNTLLRSMASISKRKGEETNWEPFIVRLKEQLDIQHKIMYPEQYKDKV
jgi:hypothetical protein